MCNNKISLFKSLQNFYQNGSSHRNGQGNHPIDLIISNLDPTIEIKDIRSVLCNLLEKYVMVRIKII